MTEWERTNTKGTASHWTCRDLAQNTPIAGFTLEGDGGEGFIVTTTDATAVNTDILINSVLRNKPSDHVFGGPIVDRQFTEYGSTHDAVVFPVPPTSTYIKLPRAVNARLCWLIHRSATGEHYVIRAFNTTLHN